MDTGHWILKTPLVEKPYGFIYLIRNNLNGKLYIGKKQMVSKTCKRPLKGKINKRRGTKESDWKTYMGSSKELLADIETYGKKNFTFQIEKFCFSKWELTYEETLMQLQAGVLLRTNEGKYYNGIIHCRLGKQPK